MTGPTLSLVRGTPLAEEPNISAQTIAGYAREVTARFGPAEALVMRGVDGPWKSPRR
jgi:fatty-acyl-CoA synthase